MLFQFRADRPWGASLEVSKPNQFKPLNLISLLELSSILFPDIRKQTGPVVVACIPEFGTLNNKKLQRTRPARILFQMFICRNNVRMRILCSSNLVIDVNKTTRVATKEDRAYGTTGISSGLPVMVEVIPHSQQ